MSEKGDMRKLLQSLRRMGCQVGRTGGGLHLITLPDGWRITSGATPGDHRTWKNFLAALRRLGIQPVERRIFRKEGT